MFIGTQDVTYGHTDRHGKANRNTSLQLFIANVPQALFMMPVNTYSVHSVGLLYIWLKSS
jgi:hypothetical protein